MELAIGMARSGGHVAIIGLAGGRHPVGYGAIPYETKIVIPFWGTQAELIEVLALSASGRITPHVESFRLDQVDEAYRRMRKATLEGRAVVTPSH
jgi:alcohol dehydrogenase, propanol-preferring